MTTSSAPSPAPLYAIGVTAKTMMYGRYKTGTKIHREMMPNAGYTACGLRSRPLVGELPASGVQFCSKCFPLPR